MYVLYMEIITSTHAKKNMQTFVLMYFSRVVLPYLHITS